jgi:hypothetical protein
MTFREKMKKPISRVGRYSMFAMVGLAAGLVHYPLAFMALMLAAWGAISIVTILVMQWLTRCPNCRTMLGALGRAATKDGATLAVCPHCGIAFDEAMK